MLYLIVYNRKGTEGRRYGVIECDPLVCKGLEKSVSWIPLSTMTHFNAILHCFFISKSGHFESALTSPPVLTFIGMRYQYVTNLCWSKQARHMVIPYMPMLVPPLNWTGYEFYILVLYYDNNCKFLYILCFIEQLL